MLTKKTTKFASEVQYLIPKHLPPITSKHTAKSPNIQQRELL